MPWKARCRLEREMVTDLWESEEFSQGERSRTRDIGVPVFLLRLHHALFPIAYGTRCAEVNPT